MHIEKFKSTAAGAVFCHIERKMTAENIDRNYSNENIDISLKHLNYRLDGNTDAYKKYKSILGRPDVKVQKRKDLNTFCSVCITLPEDVKPEDEYNFFSNLYEYLKKRYAGNDNEVLAEVHKDEVITDKPGRPHLHFVFVPLVLDEKYKKKTKEDRYKVCVKEVVNMKDLKSLHTDCSQYIADKLGYKVSILNDEKLKEVDGMDSVEMLKTLLNSNLVKNLPVEKYKEAKDLISKIIEVLDVEVYNDLLNHNELNTEID